MGVLRSQRGAAQTLLPWGLCKISAARRSRSARSGLLVRCLLLCFATAEPYARCVFQAPRGQLPCSLPGTTRHFALTKHASAPSQIKAEPRGRPGHSRPAELHVRHSTLGCQLACCRLPNHSRSNSCTTWPTTVMRPCQSTQASRERVSHRVGALPQPPQQQQTRPRVPAPSAVLACSAAPCTAAAPAKTRSASLEAAASRHSPGA